MLEQKKQRKIIYTPVNPVLLYKKGVGGGSKLHGHVSMMYALQNFHVWSRNMYDDRFAIGIQ